MAAILCVTAPGCASWNLERFSPNRLRDERAVSIERRLETAPPIVASPF
jgi:hypothetical protein